jgi:hypothetical protein
VIALAGHISAHAQHPQQSSLFLNKIGIVFSLIILPLLMNFINYVGSKSHQLAIKIVMTKFFLHCKVSAI